MASGALGAGVGRTDNAKSASIVKEHILLFFSTFVRGRQPLPPTHILSKSPSAPSTVLFCPTPPSRILISSERFMSITSAVKGTITLSRSPAPFGGRAGGTPDRARGVCRRAEPRGVSKWLPLREPTLLVASSVSPCLVLKNSKSVVCSRVIVGLFSSTFSGGVPVQCDSGAGVPGLNQDPIRFGYLNARPVFPPCSNKRCDRLALSYLPLQTARGDGSRQTHRTPPLRRCLRFLHAIIQASSRTSWRAGSRNTRSASA